MKHFDENASECIVKIQNKNKNTNQCLSMHSLLFHLEIEMIFSFPSSLDYILQLEHVFMIKEAKRTDWFLVIINL